MYNYPFSLHLTSGPSGSIRFLDESTYLLIVPSNCHLGSRKLPIYPSIPTDSNIRKGSGDNSGFEIHDQTCELLTTRLSRSIYSMYRQHNKMQTSYSRGKRIVVELKGNPIVRRPWRTSKPPGELIDRYTGSRPLFIPVVQDERLLKLRILFNVFPFRSLAGLPLSTKHGLTIGSGRVKDSRLSSKKKRH